MHFDRRFNRFVPEMGPEKYRSFSVSAPIRTHWREATCEEFECDEFVYGFVLPINTSTELGQRQYDYITHDKTRKYSMQRLSEHDYRFTYGPGNNGMGNAHKNHIVAIGRPPLLIAADGDFRGNPLGTKPYHHVRVEDWIDEFATNQDRLATIQKRG